MLDRIDLHLEVPSLAVDEMIADRWEESSEAIRERVLKARTVADLDGTEVIVERHIAEAIQSGHGPQDRC